MEKQNRDIVMEESCSSSSSSWVRGKFIGSGCFGTVSTASYKSNRRVFAVKSADLATCHQAEALENEIRILRRLKPDPHVVEFIGDDVSRDGTVSYRNLHMEYLPHGTVADLAADVADEELIRRYTWCLVSALRHVHSHGIVHCDVKGRNVLVGHDKKSVKLADFGSASEVKVNGKQIRSAGSASPRGSPLWMAPEVVRGEYQGPESDVWSVGCTVIEMVTGKPAWEDTGLITLNRIGYSDELPRIPTRLSELGRDFLDKCLKRDPNQRWTCDRLLQHPFLSLDHSSFSTESSPRCVLDWVDSDFEDAKSESANESISENEFSSKGRMCKLATNGGVIWESEGWIDVRGCDAAEEINEEYSNKTVAGSTEEKGVVSVYSDLLRANEGSKIERVKREFKGTVGIEERLRGQICKFHGSGTTVEFRFAGGSSCRHGHLKRKVGLAVDLLFTLIFLFKFSHNIQMYFFHVLIVCYNKTTHHFPFTLFINGNLSILMHWIPLNTLKHWPRSSDVQRLVSNVYKIFILMFKI